MDSSASTKAYWLLLKTFQNNKKIACIPPLFHSNKFNSNFRGNAGLFKFFAKQCIMIDNGGKIPAALIIKTTSKCSSGAQKGWSKIFEELSSYNITPYLWKNIWTTDVQQYV